jgi:hypothetical protein
MSDALDMELEAALRSAFVREERGDWDALSSGYRRARTRRTVQIVLLAGAVTLLIAATALGVAPGVGSIFGDAAPKPIKKNFALSALAGSIEMSSLRLVALTHTPDGHTLRLWTGTKSQGGTCVQIQVDKRSRGGVSCGRDVRARFGIAIADGLQPGIDSYLAGFAPAKATSVRFSFADGTTQTTKVEQGAWVTEMSGTRFRYGHDPRRMEALDANGKTLASDRLAQFVRRPVTAITRRVVVARFAGRPLTVARSNVGTTCIALKRTDGVGVDTCPGTQRVGIDMGPQEYAWIVRVGPPHTFGQLILVGALRDQAIRVRVVYTDGHAIAARSTHGIFMLQLARPTSATPARLEYLTQSGRIVKTVRLQGPKTALYSVGWRGAVYKMVTFGPVNTSQYFVGPLDWPPGKAPTSAKG